MATKSLTAPGLATPNLFPPIKCDGSRNAGEANDPSVSTTGDIIVSFTPKTTSSATKAIAFIWPVVRVEVGCLCDCSCGDVQRDGGGDGSGGDVGEECACKATSVYL